MAYEAPKPNIKPENQLHIFDIKNLVDKINEKHPYAKISYTIVDGDPVKGYSIQGHTLEEYAVMQEKINIIDEINKKYPYAKVPAHLVEGDAVTGFTVKGQTLEEYADMQNRIYGPDEDKNEESNTPWYKKN